jgi:hypothetical protein
MIYLATSKPFRSGVIPSWAPRTNAERLADWTARKYAHDEHLARAAMMEKVRDILSANSE